MARKSVRRRRKASAEESKPVTVLLGGNGQYVLAFEGSATLASEERRIARLKRHRAARERTVLDHWCKSCRSRSGRFPAEWVGMRHCDVPHLGFLKGKNAAEQCAAPVVPVSA